MLADQRRHAIILKVQRSGQVRTRELAESYGVSEVTIRADLQTLGEMRKLVKTHGGAVALPADTAAAAFDERMSRNFEAKRRIAQAAAHEIADNQSVLFDGGSTLLQLATQLPPVENLVVATNAMNIAQHLMDRPGLDVHMIGGRVDASTVTTIVSDADRGVGGLVAHQAFLGAHAIDRTLDVVDISEDIARAKRNLVRMARRAVLLADSSKWDVESKSKAFSLARVDLVITDDAMPSHIRTRLKKLGVEVRFA